MESKEFIGWFKYDPDRLWPRYIEFFDKNYMPSVDEINELNHLLYYTGNFEKIASEYEMGELVIPFSAVKDSEDDFYRLSPSLMLTFAMDIEIEKYVESSGNNYIDCFQWLKKKWELGYSVAFFDYELSKDYLKS